MSAQTIALPFPTIPEPAMPEPEDTGVTLRLWTHTEFTQAQDLGWFNDERVELILGRVYKKLTMNPPHALSICASAEMLTALFGPGFYVRQQLPVVLATDGEPVPDIVVVRGSWRDYVQHPTQDDVLLLVEVSDSTLHLDRTEKAALYAQAGIADYWLLNLPNRSLEVRREPAALPDAPLGWTYRSLTVYTEAQTVAPLAQSGAEIRVADLLPPAA
jgi:Uma2 family endonuclease